MQTTVLIPVYNGALTVERAVLSALAQTHEAVEVLVIDDGSTDASAEIVRKIAAVDDRLELLSNPSGPSGEPAVPRNLGLAQSTGDVIALLDADDQWLPNKLEQQLGALESTGADVVYGRAWVDDAGPNGVEDYHEYWDLLSSSRLPTGEIAIDLAWANVIPTCTAVVRRAAVERIGGFERGLQGVEDWYLWLRLAFAGHTFAAVEEHVAVYAWHPANFSQTNKLAMARNRVEALDRLQLLHPGERSLLQRARRRQERHLGDLEVRQVLNGGLRSSERIAMAAKAVRHGATAAAWRNLIGTAFRAARGRGRKAHEGQPGRRERR